MPKQRAKRRKAAPARKARAVPHYGQTTDFTCGPSSLIMAMQALKPSVKADRALELQLWREANTIFMGPSGGHGGCSALGLALAAHRRGFGAEVHVNHRGVAARRPRASRRSAPRSCACCRNATCRKRAPPAFPFAMTAWMIDDLAAALGAGALPIVLNSMEFLHNDPTAHWFVVTAIDDDNVYVNDPWVDRAKGKAPRDMTGVPIPRALFAGVTSYGKKRERAAVLVRRRPAALIS